MEKLDSLNEVTELATAAIAEEMTILEYQRVLRYLMRKLDVEARNQWREKEFDAMMRELARDMAVRISSGDW